jgi:3-phosphoshikimate 1-carboxyvinyltransferase
VLAVAAACAEGTTRMQGLHELRVKESDRLAAVWSRWVSTVPPPCGAPPSPWTIRSSLSTTWETPLAFSYPAFLADMRALGAGLAA